MKIRGRSKGKLPYFERYKTYANPVNLVLQVAKLNDAEKELSEISEKLKASSKGKGVTHLLRATQTFIECLLQCALLGTKAVLVSKI